MPLSRPTIEDVGGLPGGAILRAFLEQNMQGVSVKSEWGAVGDGVADDSNAFQKALDSGLPIFVPGGTYLVNNLVASKSGSRMFTGGGGAGLFPATLKKNANGPMLTVVSPASFVVIDRILFDGNGGVNTGVGIDVQFQDFQCLHSRIINMDSYCIDFTTADNTSGGEIAGCRLARTDSSPGRPMIRLAPDNLTATDKFIHRVRCTGDLLDTNSTQTVLITGCDFQNIIFQNGSKKVTAVGNRWATLGASTTVLGVNHTIVGNTHADHFIIPAANCQGCVVGPNLCATDCVDLSPQTARNRLDDTGILSMSAGFVELGEIADPAAGVANKGRLYVRDNGAGKSQLCVRFPTGAVQVLSTEP